jgi:hypothetical protein
MTQKRQPYRPNKPKTVSASTHMWADCADAVNKYAAQFKPKLSISGAIHKLLRTHPLLNLEDFQ